MRNFLAEFAEKIEDRGIQKIRRELMGDRYQMRVAKNLLARVKVDDSEFFAYVQDLAKTGVGIACNRKLIHDAAVSLFLNIPEHSNIDLDGKVAWKRDMPVIAKNKFQYGINLEDAPDTYYAYVEKMLRRQYERREHPRFNAVLEVKNEDVLDLLDATTEDVSAAGLYIRSGRPLAKGAQYEMALSGQELEKPLECIGEVISVFQCELDEFDHPYGAGVKIISFVGDDGLRFSDYLRKLEALYKFHWPDSLE
jgi:hypothetical protein